jgi:3-methylcrotonyl-CoA carboxylase alpha subunit
MRVTLRSGGHQWTTRVDDAAVRIDDAPDACVVTGDGDNYQVACGGETFAGIAVRDRERVWIMIDGALFDFTIEGDEAPRRSSGRDESALMPPMPATVLRVNVRPGDAVHDGDVLIVLEAMKMELSIRAPRDGVVAAVHCAEGDLVQPETRLIEIGQLGK